PVKAAAPTVYPLISCEDCQDKVTFGCLVNNFFPEPVTVTWVSRISGEAETFPVIYRPGTYYTLSSGFTVPALNVDNEIFQCRVDHRSTGTIIKNITGEE
uniref:Ig-like domain-containing protein n=1 Tax=Falco tinnunculus TaxID=100819 RepID=A0A8C4U1I5_FALTI